MVMPYCTNQYLFRSMPRRVYFSSDGSSGRIPPSRLAGFSRSALLNGWLAVYNCAPNNYEYIGSNEEYLIEGIGLPANFFLDSPPDSREGFVIYRSHDKESWVKDADLRGKTAYDTVLSRTLVVDTFGPLPEHLIFQGPKNDFIIGMEKNG